MQACRFTLKPLVGAVFKSVCRVVEGLKTSHCTKPILEFHSIEGDRLTTSKASQPPSDLHKGDRSEKIKLTWIIHQNFARTSNPPVDFVSSFVYKNTLLASEK